MRRSACAILLLVVNSVSAATDVLAPPLPGSAEHRSALLNPVPEHPFAKSRSAARQGYVPTNTLAFRAYALDLMVAEAKEVIEKWHLDLPKPLTTDQITGFYAVPKTTGVRGAITFCNRFSFDFEDGKLVKFCDRLYWSASWSRDLQLALPLASATNSGVRTPLTIEEAYQHAFGGQDARNKAYHQRMLQLAKMTNLLTREDALRVAQDAFRKLGFCEKELHLCEHPEVNQFTYSPEGQNITYSLPLFHVAWQHDERDGFEPVRMEVSGVTKTIVDYFNVAVLSLPASLPTNYFEMLGVPPEPRLWGKQFGYDPINTEAFQAFARDFLLEKANWLNRTWKLGLVQPITTNDLEHVQSIPHTNTFLVSAQIRKRFYLQIGEGMIQIFKDGKQGLDAFTGNREKMMGLLKEKNQLTKSSALALAREALVQIGLDEKKLRLPKPCVQQVREPFPSEEKLRDLPFFIIEWKWTDNEDEYAVMAMELSGITRKVTFFANSFTNTPRFTLPTNYQTILGLK